MARFRAKSTRRADEDSASARPEPRDGDAALIASLSAPDRAIVEAAIPYSMTGAARLSALIDAVRYLESRQIDGAFAECGVWRGGSIRTMIETLQDIGGSPREIYLYDTFSGMTEPTEADVSEYEPPALETWRTAEARGERPWADLFNAEVFDQHSVRQMLLDTGYPDAHLHFKVGPVEETLPEQAPEGPIALLRLDTDWYESTRHELEHLYPRLSTGGVLIIDDYGHFEGARRAVDEYFAAHEPVLLSRIDYTARIAIKV